jgi:hypothetical protein
MHAEHDAETRFRLRAAQGVGREPRALERLDQAVPASVPSAMESSVQSSGG